MLFQCYTEYVITPGVTHNLNLIEYQVDIAVVLEASLEVVDILLLGGFLILYLLVVE